MYFNHCEIIRLYSITDLYIRALAIIGRVYAESVDKSGHAIAGHFIRVSEYFIDEDTRIIGLLHDIVEDKKLTFKDLIMLGFSLDIINALKILTRSKEIYPNYVDYITSVLESDNELAIRVKYADMLDNSSFYRLNLLEESIKIRLTKKYENQLPRLKEKIMELNENNERVLKR